MQPMTIKAHDTRGFQHHIHLNDVLIALENGEFHIEGLTLGAIREMKRIYKAHGGKIPATKQSVNRAFRPEIVLENREIDIFA